LSQVCYIRMVVTLGSPTWHTDQQTCVCFLEVRTLYSSISSSYMINISATLWHLTCHFTDIPAAVRVRAEVTADNTSIRVSWEWSNEGLFVCLDSIRVDYQPEGGSLMMYTVDSATATSATLSNLQCNTQYTISVYAVGVGNGRTRTRSDTRVVSLPVRGTVAVVNNIVFIKS